MVQNTKAFTEKRAIWKVNKNCMVERTYGYNDCKIIKEHVVFWRRHETNVIVGLSNGTELELLCTYEGFDYWMEEK